MMRRALNALKTAKMLLTPVTVTADDIDALRVAPPADWVDPPWKHSGKHVGGFFPYPFYQGPDHSEQWVEGCQEPFGHVVLDGLYTSELPGLELLHSQGAYCQYDPNLIQIGAPGAGAMPRETCANGFDNDLDGMVDENMGVIPMN